MVLFVNEYWLYQSHSLLDSRMVTSTNYTEYGIHSTGERCLWVTWLMIVLLSSLIGDSIILIASVKYNAIKLNKFLVVIMQHIAVCDILAAITYVLPTMISLIANKWVLGDALAYITTSLDLTSYTGTSILICTLTFSKLLLLKYPLKLNYWTLKNAHLTCSLAWFLAVIFPVIRLAFDENGLAFSYLEYNMNYGFPNEKTSKTNKVIMQSMYAMTVYIPTLVVVLTTMGTLFYLVKSIKVARRTGSDQRWQGIVTVVATAVVYCVSMLPGSFSIFSKRPNDIVTDRIFESLITLNIICNFYIYSLTIPSFRHFIASKARQISRRFKARSKARHQVEHVTLNHVTLNHVTGNHVTGNASPRTTQTSDIMLMSQFGN